MWTGYYALVKKANRRALRAVDQLENARSHKQQIAFYREANLQITRLINTINKERENGEEGREAAIPFIAKFRKKAEDYLNRTEACRPQPSEEKIERLDYHTSKRY